MKLIVSDVIPCVLKFLSDCGFTETFQTLRKECDINTKGGLSQANLLKICKFYIKNHPDALIDEDESESEELEDKTSMRNEQESATINSKRLAWRDITEEDLNEDENNSENGNEKESEQEIIQIEPTKKIKTEKNENSNEKPSKISKKKKSKKEVNKNSIQQANNEEILEEALFYNEDTFYEKENKKKNKKRFSYVDAGIMGEIREDLRDNTYEAKSKYGEGDEFGRFGNERLKEVRGRDFKKEKAKLKNKQFHGGGGRIDANAKNSIKLNFE